MAFKTLMPFRRMTGVKRPEADDPFTSLRREVDRIFDGFTSGGFLHNWPMPTAFVESGFLSPTVNVAETDQGLEVTAELPGIEQKDITVDLADGMLTLRAERKAETDEKDDKKHYHVVERSYGTYMRRFALPFEPDDDKIEASFDKGVLKILVPRSAKEEKHTKKIDIKTPEHG